MKEVVFMEQTNRGGKQVLIISAVLTAVFVLFRHCSPALSVPAPTGSSLC